MYCLTLVLPSTKGEESAKHPTARQKRKPIKPVKQICASSFVLQIVQGCLQLSIFVSMFLYDQRDNITIRGGDPGRPPRLSHSSWALSCPWKTSNIYLCRQVAQRDCGHPTQSPTATVSRVQQSLHPEISSHYTQREEVLIPRVQHSLYPESSTHCTQSPAYTIPRVQHILYP